MHWLKLNSEEELNNIIENSNAKPVLIFKHSTRCGISLNAKHNLENDWDDAAIDNTQIYLLDLLNYRSVSNKIADVFDITHQSPQVLLIKEGACSYQASHAAIKFNKLVDAIN